MLSEEEESEVLSRAYVPEHSVPLMTAVSEGEPHLIEDHVCWWKEGWLIVIGYPLVQQFSAEEFERSFETILGTFKPVRVSLIAPEIPRRISTECLERESDRYYTLSLDEAGIPGRALRGAEKAAKLLTIERSHEMTDAHDRLSREFVDRVTPPERVRRLLYKMPDFVRRTRHCVVLNAWDCSKRLSAFYVVDLSPRSFSTYVMGCHSKADFVRGASDALFREMIRVSIESGKEFIHLGLGVNKGIRQFKKKWGGTPTRDYTMCELLQRKPARLAAIMSYLKSRPTSG